MISEAEGNRSSIPLAAYLVPLIAILSIVLYNLPPTVTINMWDQPTVALVTGARQGLGRAVAMELGFKMKSDHSLLILTSRTASGAEAVKAEIAHTNPKLNVCIVSWDLAKPSYEQYESDIKSCLDRSKLKSSQFKQMILVHNAASLGDMSKKVSEWRNAEELITQNNINVVSMFLLNSACLALFPSAPHKFIINFTAGSGVNPLTSYGQTAMAKASRQIALSVLALEEPGIRVLHFNPGLADTEALKVIATSAHDASQRDYITSAFQANSVDNPQDVARGLIAVVEKNDFKSGSVHVYSK